MFEVAGTLEPAGIERAVSARIEDVPGRAARGVVAFERRICRAARREQDRHSYDPGALQESSHASSTLAFNEEFRGADETDKLAP